MIHIVIGTKAQLIKMAPIMQLLQARGFSYNFIFTGQHKETISDLRQNFGIKAPDIVLYKGKDITSLPKMLYWFLYILFKAFIKRKELFQQDKDGIVLNHGDTFTTLIGSILAKLFGLRNGHVESGLRSFDLFNPFPEELTRIFVFYLTDYYFCPGNIEIDNLKKFKGEKINTGGNTLYDAVTAISKLAAPSDVEIPTCNYAIVSFHRFENLFFKRRLETIVNILVAVSKDMHLLVIMHKPTIGRLKKYGLYKRLEAEKNIELRPRYDYSRFIHLLKSAQFIMTDGGSNQEECYYLGMPCLIIRKATERHEGIGHNALVSQFDEEVIKNFCESYADYKRPAIAMDTTPSESIVANLAKYT